MTGFFCDKCESQSFEFVSCKGGQECWMCRECGEYKYEFYDTCSGG